MIPFITEAIWQQLARFGSVRQLNGIAEEQKWLMRSAWPQADRSLQNEGIERQFRSFVSVLGALREIRSRQNIPPKEEVSFTVECAAETVPLLEPMQPFFKALAKANCVGIGKTFDKLEVPPAQISTDGMEVTVDLGKFIDVEAEITRNEKLLENLVKQIAGKQSKLANENFVKRAPAEVVEKERAGLEELQQQHATVKSALQRLRSSAG